MNAIGESSIPKNFESEGIIIEEGNLGIAFGIYQPCGQRVNCSSHATDTLFIVSLMVVSKNKP